MKKKPCKSKTRATSLLKYWQSPAGLERRLNPRKATEAERIKVSENQKGRVWYNDGKRNYSVKIGSEIPDDWEKGFLIGKTKRYKLTRGQRWLSKDEKEKINKLWQER